MTRTHAGVAAGAGGLEVSVRVTPRGGRESARGLWIRTFSVCGQAPVLAQALATAVKEG